MFERRDALTAFSIAAFTMGLWMGATAAARAEAPPADLRNPQIKIEYVAPKDERLASIRQRLINRKVLETYQQFMGPLKLPQPLLVKADECGALHPRRRVAAVVTICYEFVEEIRRLAPTGPPQLVQTFRNPRRLGGDSAITGPFVQALLRETALAAFDMLDIPIWGREADAADRVAALIMLQFSKDDVAWNTIVGTAWFLAGSALDPPDLSDVRGATAQRYYTTLCIAYGGDPATFKSFIYAERGHDVNAAGDLPLSRARGCGDEYASLRDGFLQLFDKHIDPELLRRVQATKWIDFFE